MSQTRITVQIMEQDNSMLYSSDRDFQLQLMFKTIFKPENISNFAVNYVYSLYIVRSFSSVR